MPLDRAHRAQGKKFMRSVKPKIPFIPRVFISYSHDSDEHMRRVLSVGNRLCEDGVDAHLDQYEVAPPEGWIAWMEQQLESADFVLIICSELYASKFQRREPGEQGKGVKWEGLY